MKLFYGAAIQGVSKRGARAHVHRELIHHLQSLSHAVYSEHTTGESLEEVLRLLQHSIGQLPQDPSERRRFVRQAMIRGVEGNIDAAIFEVSVPSLGTGIELAHAYLRPRMGLTAIPILCLYEKDHWPNNLSSMISGITHQELPTVHVCEYGDIQDAKVLCNKFLTNADKINPEFEK